MKKIDETNLFRKDPKIEQQLRKEFNQALENEEFRLLVTKLHLKEDVLMKYTSSLEDACSEFSNCLKCKGLIECKNKLNGFAYLPSNQNGNIVFEYKACKYRKDVDKKNKYKNNVYLFNTPKELKNAKMRDIYKEDKKRYETIKWLTHFIKNYNPHETQKGLYLHGNFGCGKTYLVAATFNELAKEGIKSAIVFWPEFLRNLKSNFNGNFNEMYESVKKIPLLLIDDIGAENTTAWGRDEIFCPLIQYRMEEGLTTFFTSNLNIKELEEHFSISKDSVDHVKAGRIISRIIQLTDDIEMISQNLRK